MVNNAFTLRIRSLPSITHLVGASTLQNILRLLTNIILARLLYPEAFGIVGILFSVLFILNLSSDMGAKAFLIRNKNGNRSDYLDVLWTIQLLRGFLLCLLMILASGAISQFFGSEKLQGPLIAISFLFVITGFESMAYIVAEREQKIAKICWIELLSYVIQVLVTLVLAYNIRSHWPLVIGMITGAIFKTLFSYFLFENTLRKIRFDVLISIELWNFAKFVIVASIVTIFISQLDKVIVGRMYSLDIMGLYSMAINLTMAANILIADYFGRIFYPNIAKTIRENRENLSQIYYEQQYYIVPFLTFCCGIGIATGQLVIDILFDPRYSQAGSFVSALMIGPLLLALASGGERHLVAAGYIEAELKCQLLRLSWIVFTIYGFIYYLDILGIAICFATMNIIPKIYISYRLKNLGILVISKEWRPIIFAIAGYLFGVLITMAAEPFGPF